MLQRSLDTEISFLPASVMDPTVYLFPRSHHRIFLFPVDRGRDDPGLHGGNHLQQAGETQETRIHLDVQQECRRLPEGWNQLSSLQVIIEFYILIF